MPTKSGRLKFKDIKQGKTAYLVTTVWAMGVFRSYEVQPVRFHQKPFMQGGEWKMTWLLRNWKMTMKCAAHGLHPYLSQLPWAKRDRLFVTRAAAERYARSLAPPTSGPFSGQLSND